MEQAVDRGADAVLLTRSELSTETLTTLYQHCLDTGIDPLLETHTEAEIEFANELEAPLVGINNRDIGQLELDDGGVELTELLAPHIHDDALIVSESSLSSASEVSRAAAAGADAVLIGTAILKAEDTEGMIHDLKSV